MEKIKLFCIPHAGGSAAAYLKLKDYISEEIELYPVELAGRGRRYKEKFYESIDEAVKDIYINIKKNIDSRYAILGHSMGSLIAFELAHYIAALNEKLPIHIFFSGRKAPNISYDNNSIHKMSDIQLEQQIKKFSGTPKDVFENKQILKTFLPILRADFKICEEYIYKMKNSKLNVNISVLNGDMDDIKIPHIAAWKQHTSKKCNIYFFRGGHFYINENLKYIGEIINKNLIL